MWLTLYIYIYKILIYLSRWQTQLASQSRQRMTVHRVPSHDILMFCPYNLDANFKDSSAVGRGRAGRPARPRPTALLSPRSNGKPEAAAAVDKLLMMGMRMPETCWTVFKRQAINLKDLCIWLVDLFEYMMMHGLTNPKLTGYTLLEIYMWIFSFFIFTEGT